MIFLGKTARDLRETIGLTQRAAAEKLGISYVHLCNIENNKSVPSSALLDRYRELWGVDLYVLAWCRYGDISRLPAPLRQAAADLADAWKHQVEAIRRNKD
jgi:transcriptional regulator with XRE-family HTH domain